MVWRLAGSTFTTYRWLIRIFGNHTLLLSEEAHPYFRTSSFVCLIHLQWDPNIRDFVGCAWLVALNDYDHLLPADTVAKVEESLHTAALGDEYRVGGVDGDNLYPCYSNPWLMSTIFLSWVGHRTNDSNITASGEMYAQEFYDLWSQHQTLSEFNSPTYMGVSMWALSLWNQYAAEGSLLKKYGPEILTTTWNDMSQFYNANLKNIAGPWDRTYGYNQKQYVALAAACIWGVVGRELSPFPSVIGGMYHPDDFAFFPLFALAMPEMAKYLSNDTKKAFITFEGERNVSMQAYSPPWDYAVRNITAWISENVTIGAEQLDQTVVGGAAISPDAFNPAVIQWSIGQYGQIGSLNHFVTQSAIDAVASPGRLSISYPNATGDNEIMGAPTTFQFLFSGFDIRNGYNVTGLEGLPGLPLTVTTNAMANYSIVYDPDQTVNDFIFYNITYTMPTTYSGIPYIVLEMSS